MKKAIESPLLARWLQVEAIQRKQKKKLFPKKEMQKQGDSFQRRREALGMLQGELAIVMGNKRNTITRWEMGYYAIPRYAWILLEYIEKDPKHSKAKAS